MNRHDRKFVVKYSLPKFKNQLVKLQEETEITWMRNKICCEVFSIVINRYLSRNQGTNEQLAINIHFYFTAKNKISSC